MRRWLVFGIALAVAGVAGLSRAADPSALWHIVNDRCVPHEQQTNEPAPCSVVDLSEGREHGYALLKDINGIAQFLLLPTERISGIESAEILFDDAPNYFNLAWKSHYFVEDRLHHELPRDSISLAINSAVGRTQDQLHIHIDCLRADVKAILDAHQAEMMETWTTFPVPLVGHTYRALRVDGDDLEGHNPFKLLANSSPEVASDMGHHTLVVVGATFPDNTPGFVILDDHADLAAGDHASGEELQDHTCGGAKPSE
jgi:CDP-diacylglycerol pyrophosphatase